jgi:tRNA (guanosine-2'-O-)-methyltransferase
MHIYNYDLHENPSTDCIAYLKNKGFAVYVTSSNIKASYTPYNVPIEKPLAIMMGNEHRGISEEAIALADGVIEIPMYGFTESFNVSVAGSLILSPIVDRLRKSSISWQLSPEEQKQLYYEWIWNSFKRPDVLYKEWLVNNAK